MPFLDPTETGGLAAQVPRPVDITAKPRFGELYDAALDMSEAGAFSEFARREFEASFTSPVPGYDPFNDIAGYEDFADSFIDAESPQEVSIIKRSLDRRLQARQTLQDGGAMGVVAQLAALPADPSILLPMVGVGRGVARLGTIGRGAVVGGSAGLMGGASHEVIMQMLDDTQTGTESAINIAASSILGMMLGAGIGAVAGRSIPGIRSLDDLERAVADEIGSPVKYTGDYAGSVGAAQARTTTLQQEGVASALGAERLSQGDFIVGTPLSRTLASESLEVRRIAGDLAETPMIQNKNLEGIASSGAAETRIKTWYAPLARGLTEIDRQFMLHRAAGDVDTGTITGRARLAAQNIRDIRGTPPGKMSYAEFREEVGRAMRREDAHPVPEVAKAAKAMRDSTFEPLKREAIDIGLLPEDVSVDTALSYFTRVYDTGKIIARRPEFQDRITRWLARQRDEVAQRAEEYEAQLAKSRSVPETLAPRLEEIRTELERLQEEMAKANRAFPGVDRELKLRDERMRQLGRAMERARKRLSQMKPNEPLPKDDPLVEAITDAKRGVKPPPSLVQWLAAHGGLKADKGGEVAALGLRPGTKGVPVGAVRKDGMDLDDATRAAWDAGYIGRDGERPGIDELIDAIRNEMSGEKVYSRQDFDQLARYESAQKMAREIDERGLDINRLSTDELAYLLSFGPDESPPPYRRDTMARRSRAREAEYSVRRLQKEMEAEAAALRKAQDEWDAVNEVRGPGRRRRAGLAKERAEIEARIARATARAERTQRLIDDNRTLAGLADDELADIAGEITDKLIGASPGRSGYMPIPLVRGPLKERTLSISDYEIEDFLVSDIERVARIYTRTMAGDVELTRAFGRADMQDQIEAVNESYRKMASRSDITEKERQRLEKRRQSDISDIEGMRDRIRGTYAIPDDPSSLVSRAGRTVKQLNYLRLLGGMTLSAIPDIAKPVMMQGFRRMMGDGLVPMVRSFQSYKAAADEVTRAGTALDMILDSRALQMAELWDEYGRFSTFERGIDKMTHNFGIVSAMAPWNAFWKRFSGVLSQTRTLEAVEAIAKGQGSPREIERLAWLGIDDVNAHKIAAEFQRHGKKDNGVWWANTADWTDREAAEAFRLAIVKEVDSTIVTPGQDKPLWMSSELGSIIGQFRSFSLSSMARTATLGLQRRDAAALQGFVFSVALGMLATYFKQLSSGRPMPETADAWLVEGIDRSGMMGWVMDANNTMEKVAGLGINPILGTAPATRYSSRGAAGAVLGPTFGAVFDDAVPAARNAMSGDFSASDTHRIRKLLPYQNVFYLRGLFNQAEEAVNAAAGLPDRRRSP